MKKINRTIGGLLVTGVICGAAMTVTLAYAAEKSWQDAYLDVMESYRDYDTSWFDCHLVYLDNDDVPEFYIGDPFNYRNGALYTYAGGESVLLKKFGFKDYFEAYSEKSGIFKEYFYINNVGKVVGTNYYKLENGSLTLLDELSTDVEEETYTVNGETADKESYDAKIAEYSLESELKTYSYDEMKEYLSAGSSDNNIESPIATTTTTVTEGTDTETTTTTTTTTTTAKTTAATGAPKTGDKGAVSAVLAGIVSVGAAFVLRKRRA